MKKHSFLLLASLIGSLAVGAEVRISSVDEFIQFKDSVNSGSTYEGTTVFLDSDLSLAGKTFEPIGSSYYFIGTFDGQGYAISNLAMDSSLEFTGLFGYSYEPTIRNVILDSSCSFTSSYGDNFAYVGGIVGECYANNGPSSIENSVNMASVSFTGIMYGGYSLYLGGIAGHLYSPSGYGITVKNCANYGDVTHSGNSWDSFIGGVVGYSVGSSSNPVYVRNSLNYGKITHSGTTFGNLNIGGIAGNSNYAAIENCVSAGEISSTETASKNYVGNIVGMTDTNTIINYCYITSELGSYDKYGSGTPSSESNIFNYSSITFELDGTVSVGSYTGASLIDALNTAADTNTDYSHWLLNKNNNTVTFTINGRAAPISMNYQVILTPSLVSEGSMVFDGWYEDSEYTTPLASYEVTSDTKLYSLYGVILTVTFDKNGGEGVSFTSKKVVFEGVYGELPETTRTEYTFNGWFTAQTGGEKVESGSIVTINSDHTLYAQWTINQYTITFEANGGSKVDSITEDYNKPITLPKPTKTGYSFVYWCSDSGLTTEYKETTMPAENKTLYAKWNINKYTITFEANGGSKVDSITEDYNKPITLPEPTKTGYTFAYWCSDSGLTTEYKETTMPAENKKLYAKWNINKYTITFDFNNGTVNSAVLDFDSVIEYPEDMTRVGFTFGGWDSKPERMPAENITVKAQWTANKYTLTFDFSNGTVNSAVLDFDSLIEYPEDMTRVGFTFGGWDSKPERMPAENITVTAQWTITDPTECVDITFSQEGMTEDDVEEIIKKFVPKGAKYRVAIVESDSEGTRAGAKFNNKEKAKEFVEAVIASDEAEKSGIKTVGFFPSGCSFATSLGLSVLAYFLAYLLSF